MNAMKIYDTGNLTKRKPNFTNYDYIDGPIFRKCNGVGHWCALCIFCELNSLTDMWTYEMIEKLGKNPEFKLLELSSETLHQKRNFIYQTLYLNSKN